jgi:hypothetical protein
VPTQAPSIPYALARPRNGTTSTLDAFAGLHTLCVVVLDLPHFRDQHLNVALDVGSSFVSVHVYIVVASPGQDCPLTASVVIARTQRAGSKSEARWSRSGHRLLAAGGRMLPSPAARNPQAGDYSARRYSSSMPSNRNATVRPRSTVKYTSSLPKRSVQKVSGEADSGRRSPTAAPDRIMRPSGPA